MIYFILCSSFISFYPFFYWINIHMYLYPSPFTHSHLSYVNVWHNLLCFNLPFNVIIIQIDVIQHTSRFIFLVVIFILPLRYSLISSLVWIVCSFNHSSCRIFNGFIRCWYVFWDLSLTPHSQCVKSTFCLKNNVSL